MAARKTIDIAKAVEYANHMLSASPDEKSGERQGVIDYISTILHATGNYRGFAYIGGYRPGMDETRIQFFRPWQ